MDKKVQGIAGKNPTKNKPPILIGMTGVRGIAGKENRGNF